MDTLLKKYSERIGIFINTKLDEKEVMFIEKLLLQFLLEYIEFREKGKVE